MSIGQGDTGAGFSAEVDIAEADLNAGRDTSWVDATMWEELKRREAANNQAVMDQQAVGNAGPSQAELDAANNAAAMERQRQQQEYETRVRRTQAADAVKSAFSLYGLESLYDKIVKYAEQDWSAEAIAIALRQTPEYKARFPAMEELSKRGRAISEAAYIDYEQKAAQIEQRYGLPKGMVSGEVTGLLIGDVSMEELNDRVILASASSVSAPDDLKKQLKDYYGIDQGGLAAYYLDPDKALPLLEKQFASAQIGTEGVRQGFGIGAGLAEELQGWGVSQDQARQGFSRIGGARGLEAGRGDVVTQTQLVKGTFGDAESALATDRTATSRVNRFQGGGDYASDKSGVAALGASST